MQQQEQPWGSGAVLEVTLFCSLSLPQDEVMREVVQQQPGASVPTSFGTFPSPSFLKVRPFFLGQRPKDRAGGLRNLRAPSPLLCCAAWGPRTHGTRPVPTAGAWGEGTAPSPQPRLAQGPAAPPPPPRTLILTPAVRLLQAQREKEEGLVLCGRVTFPCEPGQGRVHKLVVTPELFRQIQSYFIS